VELIIVLVIIVMLAAILIPFSMDKINEAKGNAEIAETRMIVVGLQTMMTAAYASGREDVLLDKTDMYNICLSETGEQELVDLLDMEAGVITQIKIDEQNEVNGFVYETEKGSQLVYDEGKYVIVDLY
jgi:type II secretory pathway pseudopilin PulG